MDDLTVPVELTADQLDRLHELILDSIERTDDSFDKFVRKTQCRQCRQIAYDEVSERTARDRQLAKAIVAAKDSIR